LHEASLQPIWYNRHLALILTLTAIAIQHQIKWSQKQKNQPMWLVFIKLANAKAQLLSLAIEL